MRNQLLTGLLLAAWLSGTAWAVAPAEMSVQVRNAQLRATPSYLGALKGSAAYAERVTVLKTQGDWFQIKGESAEGWLHKSALTTKRIALKAGAADVGTTASGEEMALAGKGFNSDVEADFKKNNAEIDFGPIDAMEKIRISAEEIRAFLAEGGLQPKRGGS